MMAKSFDSVSEAQAMNYSFLFTQSALSIAEDPPAPPPLYLLSLPYEGYSAISSLVRRCRQWHTSEDTDENAYDDAQSAVDNLTLSTLAAEETELSVLALGIERSRSFDFDEASLKTRRIPSPRSSVTGSTSLTMVIKTSVSSEAVPELQWSPRLNAPAPPPLGNEPQPEQTGDDEATPEMRAFGTRNAATDRVAIDHAQYITDYIIGQQDDVAEDRWRTNMRRMMNDKFNKMNGKLGDLEEKLDAVLQRMGAARPEQTIALEPVPIPTAPGSSKRKLVAHE